MANNGTENVTGITKVNETDIICGRGGLALKHPGNAAYRKIVGVNKEIYATCLKTEKLRISKSIVAAIREINGRFLEREDGKTSTTLDEKDADGNPVKWRDIGDKKAIEKTSQALREGQPKLLKKLAERQQSAGGVYDMPINGQFNHIGGVPQTHMHMSVPQHQLQPIQTSNNTNMQGGDMYGYQPAAAYQPTSAQQNFSHAEQRGSFTSAQLAALIEGEGSSFNSGFPGINVVENGGNSSSTFGRMQSFQDSWGEEGPGPLPCQPLMLPPGRQRQERNMSTRSTDSWGEEDPTPLAWDVPSGTVENNFTTRDHEHLMAMLSSQSAEQGSSDGSSAAKSDNMKRPSVKFQLDKRDSVRSMGSMLSEMSIFSSDAASLDSAMDAVQRDAEFDMLGESDVCGMSIGTFEGSDGPKTRRSILRKSHKWSNISTFPSAPLRTQADPGLIFTSTMDARPGGVNSGTDISGLLGERRKSVVAFEVDVNRRRSSRMSMLSAMSDVSGMFKRDIGSVLSIQSADFRELMEDIGDDSSFEEEANDK